MNNKFVVKDSFVDFEGKTHKFIIAALKVPYSAPAIQDTGKIIYLVEYGLKIGVSICNPEDEFDEELGVRKAVGRADKSETVLRANFSGQLSDKVIHTFLMQEVEYIKSNPEKYIKGYNNAKKKYNKAQEMQKLENNFTDLEKLIIENIKKNPRYLDNIMTYMDYMNKCKEYSK